jgi:hypothetical protein
MFAFLYYFHFVILFWVFSAHEFQIPNHLKFEFYIFGFLDFFVAIGM